MTSVRIYDSPSVYDGSGWSGLGRLRSNPVLPCTGLPLTPPACVVLLHFRGYFLVLV